MVFLPKAKSEPAARRRDSVWKGPAPPLPHPKFNARGIPPYQGCRATDSGRKKKGMLDWMKKVLTAPVDGIAALVRKCYPSDGCMRCVKCTYWIVLIIGGIVGVIVAVSPLL